MNRIGLKLLDVYPSKAQFRSGEKVEIVVEIANDSSQERVASIRCTIWELDIEAEVRLWEAISLPPVARREIRVQAGPYPTAFGGFGAEVELVADGELAYTLSTAFDVVSDWRVAPRYGFLSDFGPAEIGDREDAQWMNKLHLNVVQFYDWMYRHDDLVSDNETYVDLMGREVSRAVVEEKIRLCHEYGMKAFAYGAVYAASIAFADSHPDWRLYTSAGDPYDFIGIFSIMNIAPDSPWRAHIVNQFRKAVERMNFDGIHLDTYGCPKTGWSLQGGYRRLERLEEQFPLLIEATREELSRVKDDIGLIFNNVGNWPVDSVALSSQECLYIEVWKPYERYFQLRDIIHRARESSNGKPVILAAYLKPFREPGPLGTEGAEHAFRLLNAVITAHGGYHLLHGEAGGVLTQGYYVDHTILRPGFMRTVRDYADFGVRYGTIHYDGKLRDVSMTHADGDNLEYAFTGFPYSTYGEAGKVWTIIGESETVKRIHFVNLVSAGDDYWNESKEAPVLIVSRQVTVAIDGEIDSIWMASPDDHNGKPSVPQYRIERTPRGLTLVIEMPPLFYWDMLFIRVNQGRSLEP